MSENSGRLPMIKRKLFFAALGWLSGLAVFSLFGISSKLYIFIAAAVITAAIFMLICRRYSKYAALMLVFALAGTVRSWSYYSRNILPLYELEGEKVSMTGIVSDYKLLGSDKILLTVKGRINGVKATVNVFCDDKGFDYYDSAAVSFNVGRIKSTELFDGEEYYRSRGIFIQSESSAQSQKTGGCENEPLRAIKRLRDRTKGMIAVKCGGNSGGFINAALCSDKSGLDADSLNAVYRAGIGHLFAVSGTHIVIIASFLQFILGFLSSPKVKNTAVACVIWCFAAFAGFSPSVVRACVMMSVLLAAELFNRRSDCANSLGFAAIMLTLPCPYTISSPSFIMSFCAAFAAGAAAPIAVKDMKRSKTAAVFFSSILISLFTIPITALFFSEISLVSPITNTLLMPICTLILVLSFIFMLFGGKFLLPIKLANMLAKAVIKFCTAVSSLPSVYIGTSRRQLLIFIGLCGAAILCYAVARKKPPYVIRRFGAVVYTFVFISMMTVKLIPNGERLIIIPDKRGYSAVFISDKTAVVFDMNSRGENSYYISQTAKSLNVSDLYVIITDEPVYTSIRYMQDMPGSARYFGDNEIEPIEPPPQSIVSDDLSVVRSEDGFEIMINGVPTAELTLENIIVSGKSYCADRFYDVSEFIL
ncbi:MAG: ComEC/Rec2 family competence protein [Oscillospiraceae bacterium]